MGLLTGHVVVGYDGSAPSAKAVDWASDEARRRALPLTVLHAVDYLGVMANAVGLGGWAGAFADDAAKIAPAGADRARSRSGAITITALTQITTAAAALVEASKSAALIVVGTHGHGPLPGVLLGSVAFTVTGYAHCPVVLVHGDAARRVGPDRAVVVGFDGSPGSAAAVNYAADVAADTGAPLRVITAFQLISPLILSGSDYVSHPSESIRPDFEAVAREAPLCQPGVRHEARVLTLTCRARCGS